MLYVQSHLLLHVNQCKVLTVCSTESTVIIQCFFTHLLYEHKFDINITLRV